MSQKKYAVLTSDLQYAAANKHAERRRMVDKSLPHICSFLEECRGMGIPVIHLQLVVSSDDPRCTGTPSELRFDRGSIGVAMLKEALGPGDIVIEKPKDSGFFGTQLDDTLHGLAVDSLILVGMQAQICIQTTAADAHFRDYKVIVPSDGLISSRQEDIDRAIDWLRDYCATILSLDDLSTELRKTIPEIVA